MQPGGPAVKDQLDVWRFDFPEKGQHPVVLISHPDRCARGALVNVLFCTSRRQSRAPYPYEVPLSSADGMDWEMFCDCSILYTLPSAKLFDRCGRVGLERRRQIRAKVRDILRLNDMD
jgi:mRNA-degrading endonuclease toxin of MazEF toxin-antitoxin module